MKEYTKSYFFMAVLTFVGGFLDVYTFVSRGGVFANTQTTNLASLGYYTAVGEFANIPKYIFPILCCILGGVVSTLWMRRSKDILHKKLFIFEIIVFIAIGFIKGEEYNMIINCTLSFMTAYQLNLFRKYGELAHNTTISTGNIRQVGELVAKDIANRNTGAKKTSIKYASLVFMFLVGAIVSALLTNMMHEYSIWLCCIMIVGIIIIGIQKEKQEHQD